MITAKKIQLRLIYLTKACLTSSRELNHRALSSSLETLKKISVKLGERLTENRKNWSIETVRSLCGKI